MPEPTKHSDGPVVNAAELMKCFLEHMWKEHGWEVPAILKFIGDPARYKKEVEQFIRTGEVTGDDTSDD